MRLAPPNRPISHRLLAHVSKGWFVLSLAIILVAALAAPAAESNKLFLWELVGDKGKAYLLGSIHLARHETKRHCKKK